MVLLLIYVKQLKKINEPRSKTTIGLQDNHELIATVNEKLTTIGDVKTIKYLKNQTGMSLIEANQFVDALRV